MFKYLITIIRRRRGDYRGIFTETKSRLIVEVNIPRKSLSLRRIIVLVFLHIQVNIRTNCPSLYTKVIFLREIICSPKMLFTLL